MHGWPIIHQEAQYRRKQWSAWLSSPTTASHRKASLRSRKGHYAQWGSARLFGGWRRYRPFTSVGGAVWRFINAYS